MGQNGQDIVYGLSFNNQCQCKLIDGQQQYTFDHLQQADLSHCNLLHNAVFFGLEELLDGDQLSRLSMATFQHHAVTALAHYAEILILVHGDCGGSGKTPAKL